MTAATAVSARPAARRQFQSLFKTIPFLATLNMPSVADAEAQVATVAVPGATLGDFVMISLALDNAGLTVTGYVSASDVVTVIVQNDSGAGVDLASTTVKGCVFQPDPNLFY